MLFRVQIVDKATGAQADRIYRAESADRAAEMAMREGYLVGHVFREADAPVAAPEVGGGGRLASYGVKAPRQSGLRGFFNFDVLLFPIIIRMGFLILTALTVLGSIVTPIIWLIFVEEKTRESALELLYTLGVIWLGWVGYRLIAEWLIVFFTIREELAELNGAPRPRG
jgi:hypothetical protein